MNSGTEQAVVSCDPESEAFALRELRDLWPDMPAPQWLSDGVALIETGQTFGAFAAQVQAQPPIFVRHIAPVQWQAALGGASNDPAGDVDRILAPAEEIAARLNPEQTFAVQTRLLSDGPHVLRKFDVNHALSERLAERTGATMECKTPAQVVSVLCTSDRAYMGVSLAAQNRSAWPGGEHRFKREEGQISRAEFKLLEALAVFGLQLPSSGKALDMGAAPGGWTRVLRQHSLRVVAVDPADLDVQFRRDPNVTHLRQQIETFLPSVKTRFDVIVNDMRMDMSESVEIMLKASAHLVPDGPALMTLKLVRHVDARQDTLSEVRQALERLARDYEIVGARQLYYNRSEVTVALRARRASEAV